MINHVTTGFSMESEAAALAEALGHASSFSKDAESVHIIVLGVYSLSGGGYKAVARVIVEPKIKGNDEAKNNNSENSNKYDQENFDDDNEKSKSPDVDIDIRHEGGAHIYSSDEYEGMFNKINIADDIESVHFISSDALWDAVQDIFPDVDFYEAVYKNEMGGHVVEDKHIYKYEKSLIERLRPLPIPHL